MLKNASIIRRTHEAILPSDFDGDKHGAYAKHDPQVLMDVALQYANRFENANPAPLPVEALVINGVPQTDRGRELLAEANRKLAAGVDPQERGNEVGCILGDNKLRQGRQVLRSRSEGINVWSRRASNSQR